MNEFQPDRRLLESIRVALGLQHLAFLAPGRNAVFELKVMLGEAPKGSPAEGTAVTDLGAAASAVSSRQAMLFNPEDSMPLRTPYTHSSVNSRGAMAVPLLEGVIWADRSDRAISNDEFGAFREMCDLVETGTRSIRDRQVVEKRVAFLVQVIEGLRDILTSTSEQTCVARLVETAARQTGARTGLVVLLGPYLEGAAIVGGYGADARELLGKSFDLTAGLMDLAVRSGTTVPTGFKFTKRMTPVLGAGVDLPVSEGEGLIVQPLGGGKEPLGALILVGGEFEGSLVIHGIRTLCDSSTLLMHRFRMQTRIEQDAMMDDLTGMYNRQAFMKRVAETFAFCKRHGHQLCLLMVDADHFKRVNDEYGHQVGDRVLRFITDTIQRGLRESDVAGRYGGEEFCVLLPHTDLEGARFVAERVRERCAASPVPVVDDKLLVTVSIGVCAVSSVMEKPEDLIAAADSALYEAKDGGRNLVVVAKG